MEKCSYIIFYVSKYIVETATSILFLNELNNIKIETDKI